MQDYQQFKEEYLSLLCKPYSSLNEFVSACEIDILSVERDNYPKDYPSSEKRFNVSHFFAAVIQENKLYIPLSEEEDQIVKRPISSAIALKMLMPYLTSELKKQRSFSDGVVETLQNHYGIDSDAIFTDCYLKLSNAINKMDFSKFVDVEDKEELQSMVCGYLRMYIFEIVQNYARDLISKTDFEHGRKKDAYLYTQPHSKDNESSSTSHKVGFFIDGLTTAKHITINDTQKFAVYNHIPEEHDDNDEIEFKQARVLRYFIEHNGKIGKNNPKDDKEVLCSSLYNEKVKLIIDKKKAKDISTCSTNSITKYISQKTDFEIKVLKLIKSIPEEQLDDIINKFNIERFDSDVQYTERVKTSGDFIINTSSAFAEHLFDPATMEYKIPYHTKVSASGVKRKCKHTEEFYRKHPNYKRNDNEDIIKE